MNIPGFIDLQVNGYMGVDFSSADLTEESFANASQQLLNHGTAAFLATIITSSLSIYKRNLNIMANVISSPQFQERILGIHAEGPFISTIPGAVGAHNPEWVQKPSKDSLDQLQDWANGNIKLITIAADITGAEDIAAHALDMKIAVSLGHQMADINDLQRLSNTGAKTLTHFGNGMPNTVNRHSNTLLAGLATPELSAMIITDGHHLPAHLIETIIKVKGTDKTIVISDASPIAGMPPGKYKVLGNRVVLEETGLLYNPEKNCMVGSSATMLECMNHLASLKILNLSELIDLGFYNPLKIININPESVTSQTSLIFDEDKMLFQIS